MVDATDRPDGSSSPSAPADEAWAALIAATTYDPADSWNRGALREFPQRNKISWLGGDDGHALQTRYPVATPARPIIF